MCAHLWMCRDWFVCLFVSCFALVLFVVCLCFFFFFFVFDITQAQSVTHTNNQAHGQRGHRHKREDSRNSTTSGQKSTSKNDTTKKFLSLSTKRPIHKQK